MHQNQFVQITGPGLQKSLILRPPPILSSPPSSRNIKPKQKLILQQIKRTKQLTRPIQQDLQTKIFDSQSHDHDNDKSHRNIQQMIKMKLRVSEYANTHDGDSNHHGMVSKIGCKRLHKKKDTAREIIQINQQEISVSLKRIDKMPPDFQSHDLPNGSLQDKLVNSGSTHMNFSSQKQKPKQQEQNYPKFRSSSVIALHRSSNQKRIKLVLKSTKRLGDNFNDPVKIPKRENKSESKLDYSSNYEENEDCCRFQHCEQPQQMPKPPHQPQKHPKKPIQFQITKRPLQKFPPKKQPKKTTNESSTNFAIAIDMDMECIDAWKNSEQLNQTHTHLTAMSSYRQHQMEIGEDQIVEFVQREMRFL